MGTSCLAFEGESIWNLLVNTCSPDCVNFSDSLVEVIRLLLISTCSFS